MSPGQVWQLCAALQVEEGFGLDKNDVVMQ